MFPPRWGTRSILRFVSSSSTTFDEKHPASDEDPDCPVYRYLRAVVPAEEFFNFIPTANDRGFMTLSVDPVSQAAIDYAAGHDDAPASGTVVGAARGNADEGAAVGAAQGNADEGAAVGAAGGNADEDAAVGAARGNADEDAAVGADRGNIADGGVPNAAPTPNLPFLDIGAAFGTHSLRLLHKLLHDLNHHQTLKELSHSSQPPIIALDPAPEHLFVLRQGARRMLRDRYQTKLDEDATAKIFFAEDLVQTVEAEFPWSDGGPSDHGAPGELHDPMDHRPEPRLQLFPGPSSVQTVLACRVFHFFPPTVLRNALRLVFALLKPGGRFFLVSETPYLGNLSERFRREYERSIAAHPGEHWETSSIPGNINKDLFPGFVADFARADSRGGGNLPKSMHFLCPVVVTREMRLAGFQVERCEFLDRRGDFPEFLKLDGRESVGCVAVKP